MSCELGGARVAENIEKRLINIFTLEGKMGDMSFLFESSKHVENFPTVLHHLRKSKLSTSVISYKSKCIES